MYMCKSSEGYRNFLGADVNMAEDFTLLALQAGLAPVTDGKGDGVVESDTSDTSDTLTPGEVGSCGSGGNFGGGRERLSATTFAAPGVWRRSLVNSEI